MAPLSYDRYRVEVVHQTGLLRDVLQGVDPATEVPTCPGWTLADLVGHIGGNLRAVGAAVRDATGQADDATALDDDPTASVDRISEEADRFAAALRAAEPGTAVAVWSVPGTALSWARRATHDLVVHRADAAGAVGADYTVAPEVAVDALDEFLELLQEVGAVALPGHRGGGIRLHATDTEGAEWLVEPAEKGFTWRRGPGEAAVTLRGPLTDVLRVFYRRLPATDTRVEVSGDAALLDRWLEQASLG
ncbi:maleylpyruvate isomerase family mycothiol-dependent enzyme [Thermobifida halotolerans]|uniref:Maleylpyruvate isomerase family mycothiol-dependent enzyme n=1 Tax=Thermobifida halotolerans TaxID=483545 RepID=A0A399G8X5_9ACTN|nr:maleylpyruvate isomerase family mycothiol-dependent enzyme [Thermobifida halotolerans]UOE20590.1 maleylpyruvate isomerase family mycothiol-dependent enzyme [Thermobifida halotolerans]